MMVPAVGMNELARARLATDKLFAVVQPDSLYERPISLRHRLIFYVGHVEAFDWNLVVEHGVHLDRFDADLDRLFAFGIDPAPGQEPSDAPSDWPSISRIDEYRSHVRECVDEVWNALPTELQHVSLEHRLMHAETVAYMLHNMDCDRLQPQAAPDKTCRCRLREERIEVPGGHATLGLSRGAGFGWDNEFEELVVEVSPFAISRYKVTNGEYLDFVEQGAPAPHFWLRRNGEWLLRRMFDHVPLPLCWPVWVTREEAAAYAAWRGGSLPSEAHWHRAAYGTPEGIERRYPWGNASPDPIAHGNFGAHRWNASPVNEHPAGRSAFAVEGLVGNGWEWTSTPFAPLPGFRPFSFYPGYSADFFDGEHYVLKGGSPRTDSVFLRRSFRNWFRSDYPYVFAGFRCMYETR
jgi:formylglycine-generating enzyme required for sulfatase activity